MKQELIENEDFYFNEVGNMVFTEKYLLAKGECAEMAAGIVLIII